LNINTYITTSNFGG